MLSKSPALPLVTADTTAFGFCTTGNILSPPVVKLSNKKSRGRLNVQRNIDLGKPRDATQKWRVLSADQAQASVVDVDEECKQVLTSLNFSNEDAEKMLKKAFGWIHSPYWSEERKKEVPSAEVVTGVLDYIRSLGLSDEDLHKLLKKFPEVLGCDLDSEVKLNVSKLDSDWGINGQKCRIPYVNCSTEDAEVLKKSFGWTRSPYWSEGRKEEDPNAELVTGVLNYIRSLGLSEKDLHKLLKKFLESSWV